MQRGEIWWAELPAAHGSAPAFRRPVLVVQSDAFNRSRIATVVVVPFTSTLRLADAPGNVLIPLTASHLDRDSVANVSQVVTLSRTALTDRVGPLPPSLMREVSEGLKLVLAL